MTGGSNLSKLSGVDAKLADVIRVARSRCAFHVVEGLRSDARQAQLFSQGKSKVFRSKHQDGQAVDITVVDKLGRPIFAPAVARNKDQFMVLLGIAVGVIKSVAAEQGVNLRLGADFNGNFQADDSFLDAFHIELV